MLSRLLRLRAIASGEGRVDKLIKFAFGVSRREMAFSIEERGSPNDFDYKIFFSKSIDNRDYVPYIIYGIEVEHGAIKF